MPFKFVFLGLEISSRNSKCASIEKEKMAKKKTSKNILTPQQKKFKKAQKKCHAETDSPSKFGSCMSEKLTKKRRVKK